MHNPKVKIIFYVNGFGLFDDERQETAVISIHRVESVTVFNKSCQNTLKLIVREGTYA
jgi:hypothetical protein